MLLHEGCTQGLLFENLAFALRGEQRRISLGAPPAAPVFIQTTPVSTPALGHTKRSWPRR